MNIQIKRVYDQPASSDGFRVLVDRLWPRGVSKREAAIDWWAKDLAPSAQLRQWFSHKDEKFPEFRRRYRAELKQKVQELNDLSESAGHSPVVERSRPSRATNRWKVDIPTDIAQQGAKRRTTRAVAGSETKRS